MAPAAREPKEQLNMRRTRFSQFVARALDVARSRGMTITDIEKATGLGNSTFYAWANGEWTRDPVTARVQQFCEGLGLSLDEAYRALGWATPSAPKRTHTEPIIDDPDLRLLLRKLTSPNTPAAEKLWIRRQIRSMAEGLKDADDEE